MKVDFENLQKTSLYRLREIGRELGVRAPAALKKAQLIKAIEDVVSGKTSPYYSNRGRPVIKGSAFESGEELINKEKIKKIDLILNDAKKEILKVLFEK